MPAPFPVNKCVRVRTIWTDDAGTPHGIRQFFTYSGVNSDSDATLWADGVLTGAWGQLAAVMSVEKTITETIIEDLTSDTSPVGLVTGTEPGAETGDFLPASVVAIGNFFIPRRYRGGHPRSALPFGVQSDLLNAQQWTTDAQTNFLAALAAYIEMVAIAAPGALGAVTHVNVSYTTGGGPRAVPLTTPVSGYGVNQRVGAQRRRLGRSSG